MTDGTPAAPAPDTTPAPPTDAAAVAARDAELTALYESDPNKYAYAEGGRFANEHLALKKAQQPKGAITDEAADGDLDLLADDGDDAGEGEEPLAEEAEREPIAPWQPPDNAEVAEIAKPHLASIDDIVSNTKLTAEQKRDGVLAEYHKLVAAQKLRLEEADKVATKASVEALGGKDAYAPLIENAKAVMKSWPKELRDAVRDARTSDGRRLALMPEFVQALATMRQQANPQQPQDRSNMLKAELQELNALRDTDIDKFMKRPWKGTSKSGSDRSLEIVRELSGEATGKPSEGDLQSEARALRNLRVSDPQMFMFGNWKNSGRPGADRLAAIETGRT
jgi:hypothetical protein